MEQEVDGAEVEGLRFFAHGRCLVRDVETGETFLAGGVIPGERATVRRWRGVYGQRAAVSAVLRPAASRVEPFCPHFGRCTGCELLHVGVDAELRYKKTACAEVLARFAQIEVEAADIEILGGAARGDHRARARFTVAAGGALGLRDAGGDVVDVADCPASTPAVRAAMLAAQTALRSGALRCEDGDTIEVIEGVDGVAVVLPREPGVDAGALRAQLGAHALAARVDGAAALLDGAWPRQLPVGDVTLDAAVDAWVQPTPSRAAALYSWVAQHAKHGGRRVLDATCGTGGLSLLLAREAAFVLGVDANIEAVRSAQRSAQTAGAGNVEVRGGLAQTVLPRLVRDGARFDVALVNPMRRSLGADTMQTLPALGVERVIYLGPAPRAAAEDIRALLDAGFALVRAAGANLHPGTAQVMLCAVLTR